MHGCKGSVWLNDSGKVGRQAVSAESSSNEFERIQPENLVTVCHSLEEHPATETSERLAGNQKKEERSDLQTKRNFDAPSVSRSFLFLPKVHC